MTQVFYMRKSYPADLWAGCPRGGYNFQGPDRIRLDARRTPGLCQGERAGVRGRWLRPASGEALDPLRQAPLSIHRREGVLEQPQADLNLPVRQAQGAESGSCSGRREGGGGFWGGNWGLWSRPPRRGAGEEPGT